MGATPSRTAATERVNSSLFEIAFVLVRFDHLADLTE
jgi:hypothetical protein